MTRHDLGLLICCLAAFACLTVGLLAGWLQRLFAMLNSLAAHSAERLVIRTLWR